MTPLFAEEVGQGQVIGITALVSTIITGIIAGIGTYLSNRQAARVKAEERDNDDKWRIIERQGKEISELQAGDREHRSAYSRLSEEHTNCREEQAAAEERIAFLESVMKAQGIRVPRRRKQGETGSDHHLPLPPTTKDKEPKHDVP